MANKKYNDFPAGTFDPAKIFLQADPTTGSLQKILLGDIPSGGLPFTFYLARLTQSGTNQPTAFESSVNTISTLAWSRISAGIYQATLADTFPLNKTFAFISNSLNPGDVFTTVAWGSTNYIRVITANSSGDGQDDSMGQVYLLIIVTP